jgi:hypothetical protein
MVTMEHQNPKTAGGATFFADAALLVLWVWLVEKYRLLWLEIAISAAFLAYLTWRHRSKLRIWLSGESDSEVCSQSTPPK